MGIPWIKNGKIDITELHKIKWRNASDSITFIQACQIIADRINEVEEEKERMKEKVRQYEEEINADVRIQELTSRLEELQGELLRSFRIYEDEEAAVTKWKEKHDIEAHGVDTFDKKMRAGGAIGGRYTYEFYPTSIGTAGVCVCNKCKRRAIQESAGDYKKFVELKKKYDAEFEFRELG